MRSAVRSWPAVFALLLGACISLEEARIAPSAVRPGQRTVLVVYCAPGPWVIPYTDSKAESAAKTMPGLSFVVQSFQEERNLKESKDLQQYLPRWSPEKKLLPFVMEELPKTGFTGAFISTGQAEFPEERLRQFNRATDVLGWQKAYYYEDPTRGLSRNYGSLLNLDDALIFEVNLLYGVDGNEDGNMVPTLSASSRLFHANTMRPIWQHEDSVDDPPAARSLYEFKTLPRQLVDDWEKLLPSLAAKVAASLRASLAGAVPYASSTPGASEAPAMSTAAWQGVTAATAPSAENMDTAPSPAPSSPPPGP